MLPASIALLCLATALLLHHGWKHASDDPANINAQRESCWLVCYFQPKDIMHFETWIMVCLTNAVSFASASSSLAEILCAVALFLALMLVVTHTVLYSAQSLERNEHLLPTDTESVDPGTNPLSVLLHNVSNHETWIVVCLTNAASLQTGS